MCTVLMPSCIRKSLNLNFSFRYNEVSLSWTGSLRAPMTRRVILGERKLLVRPSMPVAARRSVVPGPPLWGLSVGLKTPPPKNLLLRNRGGGQDPHAVVAPVNKKKTRFTFYQYESKVNCYKNSQFRFQTPKLIRIRPLGSEMKHEDHQL
jgi:hypothetical protein